MEKYAKLMKGLEMCAGPECSTECPYNGETRGGKTCRTWLLHDAAAALALETKADRRLVGSDDMAEKCETYRAEANYWHGQADALKWCLHNYFDGSLVECRNDVTVDMELPEAEASSHE